MRKKKFFIVPNDDMCEQVFYTEERINKFLDEHEVVGIKMYPLNSLIIVITYKEN